MSPYLQQRIQPKPKPLCKSQRSRTSHYLGCNTCKPLPRNLQPPELPQQTGSTSRPVPGSSRNPARPRLRLSPLGKRKLKHRGAPGPRAAHLRSLQRLLGRHLLLLEGAQRLEGLHQLLHGGHRRSARAGGTGPPLTGELPPPCRRARLSASPSSPCPALPATFPPAEAPPPAQTAPRLTAASSRGAAVGGCNLHPAAAPPSWGWPSSPRATARPPARVAPPTTERVFNAGQRWAHAWGHADRHGRTHGHAGYRGGRGNKQSDRHSDQSRGELRLFPPVTEREAGRPLAARDGQSGGPRRP